MVNNPAKIRQPIPAAEWFDFDREGKTMKFLDQIPNYDDDPSGKKAPDLISCPICASYDILHVEWLDDEEGGHRPGARFVRCGACGNKFIADDED